MNTHNRKISVVGLGYVGLPVAVEFWEIRQVIGFDINSTRIDELKQGSKRNKALEALMLIKLLVCSSAF
jgi:UDP-N-acetyl-D-galactosamine dehydrogenase